jgi:NADH-quinone oxidoreductase subunit A
LIVESKPLLYLLIYGFMVVANAFLVVGVSYLLGLPRRSRVKDVPYESGIAPTGGAQAQTMVPYYLVAICFILFDVEILFLYTYGIDMYRLRWDGFVKAMIFLFFVFGGLVYIWLRGGLIWRHLSTKASDKASSSQS